MSETSAMSVSRLEAFSDGVFAIAITLLIIEVHVPAAEVVRQHGLWGALWEHWPNYAAYLLSFAVIGIMWANHHNVFRYIKRSNHMLLVLNGLLLLCVAFLPFPTAVLATYLRDPAQRTAATVFYGAVLTVTAIVYNALWRYATHRNRLVAADANGALVKAITREFSVGPVMYGAATGLAFVSVWLSLAVHAGLALLYVLPTKARP